ncbi:MAG: hypothetical protein OXS35_01650, partial [Dehalococcoidia bacterium]|nr:hypothetical protein [Dehalococcoidia bacterium]
MTRYAEMMDMVGKTSLAAVTFPVLAAISLIGLLAIAEPALAEVVDIEVRVAAQRLADGRTEFAIQQRREGEE